LTDFELSQPLMHGFRSFVATILASIALACGGGDARAQLFDTKAPHALLMDYDSGTVLFEKAADEPFEPASMAKLMTAEYAFKELKEGTISLDDQFTVSEHAWRTGGAPAGGSAMFAELHSSVPVGDLLRGLIVQSGNDAAIVIAEGIAGSEPAFADLLNKRASELGLKNSRFMNANGLHDPDQVVTVRDLAILARHIIQTYPEYYRIFSEPEFTWNKIRQTNRNPLIGEGIGVDGLKTGFIKESGYGIVASALRNDQRLVLALGGLQSETERIAETKRILDWGFRNFTQLTVFEADEVIAEASVYGGITGRVPLKADGPIRILVARDAKEALKARALYQGPLMAPVQEGEKVGVLRIWEGERIIQETPLHTAGSVEQGALHARAVDALGELLFGWLP
jgi:D-alanyl-D-alanine carboxypeptidase (penicillin-binding protein 5/6)